MQSFRFGGGPPHLHRHDFVLTEGLPDRESQVTSTLGEHHAKAPVTLNTRTPFALASRPIEPCYAAIDLGLERDTPPFTRTNLFDQFRKELLSISDIDTPYDEF